MNDIAVRVENLGKRYRIGQIVGYGTLRESLMDLAYAPFRRLRQHQSTSHEPSAMSHESNYIWALKDVSFEVKRGEAVGIIGRNGSGKTTILKILSRITAPTEGLAEIHGRVGSLLEVGTGFHPELTGRENIYLNGAVLGMKKAEVERKFDEIVAFSEIEKFLDTPVKRYSSGMYVRLAFAVAAHLEPEILIVDEVLAVGDAAFQKKCLGKMSNVASEGRTVLFVSHNMHAVANLCQKVIWLNAGIVESIGSASEQVAKYMAAVSSAPVGPLELPKDANAPAFVQAVRIIDAEGKQRDSFDLFEPFAIELKVVQRRLQKPVRLVIRIRSATDGSVVLATTDWDSGNPVNRLEACEYTVRCFIPGNLLNSGSYLVSLGVDEPRGPVLFRLDNVRQFAIVNTSSFGDGLYGERDGVLSPYREWKLVSSKPLDTD